MFTIKTTQEILSIEIILVLMMHQMLKARIICYIFETILKQTTVHTRINVSSHISRYTTFIWFYIVLLFCFWKALTLSDFKYFFLYLYSREKFLFLTIFLCTLRRLHWKIYVRLLWLCIWGSSSIYYQFSDLNAGIYSIILL
jgi:hypothetical protein